jgi:hypothetical protein
MQLPLKPFALLAIVLVKGAESSSVLAGVDEATISRGSPQISADFDVNAEHSSRLICESELAKPVEINGSYSNFIMRRLPDEARLDARRAEFEVDARRTASVGVTLNGGTNLCWIGGEISSRGASRVVEKNNRARSVAMVVQNSDPYARVAVSDLRIRGGVNGFSITGNINSVIWERGDVRDLSSSCILLNAFTTAILRDSLFDGCGSVVEFGNDSDAQEIVLQDNVIRVSSKSGSVTELGHIFSTEDSYNPRVVLYRNVILFEGPVEHSLEYFYDRLLANVLECGDNIFIFPGIDPAEEIESDCGLITHNRTVWEEAKAAWLHINSDDQSIVFSSAVGENRTSSRDVGAGMRRLRSSTELDVSEERIFPSDTQIETAEAGDVVSDSQNSVREVIAAAQRASRAVDRFLSRWSDDTFWLDGTGWVE